MRPLFRLAISLATSLKLFTRTNRSYFNAWGRRKILICYRGLIWRNNLCPKLPNIVANISLYAKKNSAFSKVSFSMFSFECPIQPLFGFFSDKTLPR